ncbi:MAG: cysteine synthase A, partial [Spirochaetales bacterium]|nr:cysteine synthase A [Spirochaetales bacterium]
MGKKYSDVTQLIGNTPLVELVNIARLNSLKVTLLAKLEMLNPGGSVKDRIAKAMIERAEEEGLLKEGSTIIEPTSGNTGIGLALMAAAKGYRLILTMPETMSRERRLLLEAYGAEVVLTEGPLGMKGSIAKAEELAQELSNAFIPNQFANPANPEIHFKTTGDELWEDSGGSIDYFVAGVGTGGTISGAGAYLKSKKSSIKVIAVEPAGSPILSSGVAGKHRIQGIGAGFIPATLNTEIYDQVITVENEEAFEATRLLARHEGILAGISSGAALVGALKVIKERDLTNVVVAIVLPDHGDRY